MIAGGSLSPNEKDISITFYYIPTIKEVLWAAAGITAVKPVPEKNDILYHIGCQ